ncbi:MAG: OmpA family protein [Bacteroidales bacterium]|nr:OmpA family protein [Bacteroidales bacterium]MDT8430787.1 OmpA family protein [Bacteroidales bacterium]
MMHKGIILLVFLGLIAAVQPVEGQRKERDTRANAAYEAGEYYKAIDLFKRAYSKVSDRERQAEIVFKIAECYRITGEPRQAALWYRKALQLDYQDPELYLRYGQSLMRYERFEEAEEQFRIYKDLVPDDPRGDWGIESARVTQEWMSDLTGYIVENMRYFNSFKRDWSPAYANEDYMEVMFTSTRDDSEGKAIHGATGESFADIYSSTMDRKGKWSVPVPVEPLNSEFEDGAVSFTSDFSTLYMTRCKMGKNEQVACQIYTSSRSGAQWSDPAPLDIIGDSITSAHPAISPDGQTLYFVSDMPGGIGGNDIWVVTKEGGSWGDPKNLGEEINTPGNELFPFVHDDGTLYFSSGSRIGMGGLDIYKARKDELGNWIVENMRPPINSVEDDFGIVFEAGSERGFFSSSRKGRGNDEIFSFVLPPLEFAVNGTVRDDKDNSILSGAKVTAVGSDGITIESTTGEDGTFRFMLKPATDYVFIAGKEGYLRGKARESTKGLEQSKEFDVTVYLSSTERVIELPNIFYDFAKWDLRPESMVSLDNLVETLNDNPNVTIELMSHTDSRGAPADNIELSQKRAQSVVDYLISKGIAADRLMARGYGESQPKVVDEKILESYDFLEIGDVLTESFINQLPVEQQEQAHQINRRTEFRVLSTDYIP